MVKHRQDGLLYMHGIVLSLAVAGAFFGMMFSVESLNVIRFNDTVNWGAYAVALFIALFWIQHGLSGVGDRLSSLGLWGSIRLSANQATKLAAIMFALAFVTRDINVSRAFLVGFVFTISVMLVLLNLYMPRILAKTFYEKHRLRTVILAQPEEAGKLKGWFDARRHLGIDLIGFSPKSVPLKTLNSRLPCLGSADELRHILLEYNVDQIVLSQTDYPGESGLAIARIGESVGCRVRSYVDLNGLFFAEPLAFDQDDGYAFATWTPEPLDLPLNRVMKRALDVSISLPVVVLLLPPLTFCVWLAQLFQSPGPILYRQLRSGLNKQKFFIYKFRTMHVRDNAAKDARQATKGDSRIYAFGKFLRKSSLDEIPQFLNVLLGEMSVSGPRPHLIEHDDQFAKIVSFYHKRHFVKPGITGLAQSKGLRGEITESSLLLKRINYDIYYVSKWSLVLDFKIIFDTVVQVFSPPDSAY